MVCEKVNNIDVQLYIQQTCNFPRAPAVLAATQIESYILSYIDIQVYSSVYKRFRRRGAELRAVAPLQDHEVRELLANMSGDAWEDAALAPVFRTLGGVADKRCMHTE